MIKVGTIISTFGIKGQVKIYQHAGNLAKMWQKFIANHNDCNLIFRSCKKHKDDIWLASIEGITTPEQAKNLVGIDVYVKKHDFTRITDEIYDFDVISKSIVIKSTQIKIGSVNQLSDFKYCKLLEISPLLELTDGNVCNGILYVDTRDIIEITEDFILIKDLPKVV